MPDGHAHQAIKQDRAKRLGIGFIGSGFNARFHMQAFRGVRDADVLGVWSPNAGNAGGGGDARARARRRACQGVRSRSRRWSPIPTSTPSGSAAPTTRASRTSRRSSTRSSAGKGELIGHRLREAAGAQRRRGEARCAELVRAGRAQDRLPRESGLRAAGRDRAQRCSGRAARRRPAGPYLARAAEEHSGPHMPWFWQGELQGGGVLNDMMCHSALVVRHLLTEAGRAAVDGEAGARSRATSPASSGSRPEYAKQPQAR